MKSFATVALSITLLIVTCSGEDDHISTRLPTIKVSKHSPKQGPGGRHARATPYSCATPATLTAAQNTESVSVHNKCRAGEPAANMLSMSYNSMLANVAQGWANQCKWEHGGLVDCNGNNVGQNLYVSSNPAAFPVLNLTNVIVSWNNERNDWNFQTATCKTGAICGHWTALVAARSWEVGCAYANCPTMNVAGAIWKNALYVVCDYNPPGNVVGDPIYLPGTKCSNCDSDSTGLGFKCVDSLCVSCSPATDAACKCGVKQTCVNGGVWSTSTCKCVCPKAFYGATCERACSCADALPDDCVDWSDLCTDPSYTEFLTENCMSTCKFKCALPASCTA